MLWKKYKGVPAVAEMHPINRMVQVSVAFSVLLMQTGGTVCYDYGIVIFGLSVSKRRLPSCANSRCAFCLPC